GRGRATVRLLGRGLRASLLGRLLGRLLRGNGGLGRRRCLRCGLAGVAGVVTRRGAVVRRRVAVGIAVRGLTARRRRRRELAFERRAGGDPRAQQAEFLRRDLRLAVGRHVVLVVGRQQDAA